MQTIFNTLAASTASSKPFLKTLNEWSLSVRGLFATLGPIGDILLVIIILWVGKMIVNMIGKLVSKALSKTSADDYVAAKLGHEANVTRGITGFVKAILMLFVLIFALDTVGLNTVGEPLKNLFNQILEFIPRLLLAGLMAYIVIKIAGLVKQLLSDVLTATKLDERLGSIAGTTPVSNALTTAAYAFLLLLFTPAVLDILKIEAVSKPIKGIVDQIVGSVDNILLAGVILFLGCLIGNIAKRLVTNLLQATNVDSFPNKLGITIPGGKQISAIAGTIVMVSVIVLTFTAAIDMLEIGILSKASNGLVDGYFNILLALLILLGGLIGARFAYDSLIEGNAGLAKLAKFAIIVLTSVVALNRTGLAPELTGLPYTVAIYAAGIAFGIGGAIAIGLGGQSFVSRWFEKRG